MSGVTLDTGDGSDGMSEKSDDERPPPVDEEELEDDDDKPEDVDVFPRTISHSSSTTPTTKKKTKISSLTVKSNLKSTKNSTVSSHE
jgi:hypothetical protein